MRTAILTGALAAFLSLTVVPGRWSLVKAQSLAALPTCAQPAILAAIQASGCQITDKKCFCGNPALIPSLTSSIREACSASDQAALAAFASTYCGTNVGAGLMFSSPPALPAPASAASSTTAMPPTTSSLPVSVSLTSSTITSTANMTMNSTMTMTSMSNTSSSTMSMSTSSSSIDWPTGVTAGGAVVETGMAMAALAVAAGAMGLVLGEL